MSSQASDSESPEEAENLPNSPEDVSTEQQPLEDSQGSASEDVEDYDPSMAVECILDNSSEDEFETVTSDECRGSKSGHVCATCKESFASLIALKEHTSLHCWQKNTLRKPGEWRRRKKVKGKRKKTRTGNEIRCFECRLVFPDRVSFLDHFSGNKCNVGRQRIEYTDEEQAILVMHYNGNNFPNPLEMSLLAKRLGVRYRQIMHWFQNRRSKERKQQGYGEYNSCYFSL